MKKGTIEKADYRISAEGATGGPVTLSVSGQLALGNRHAFFKEAENLLHRLSPSRLGVDLAGLHHVDSSGALALVQLKGEAEGRSVPFEFSGMTEETRRLIDLINLDALSVKPLIEERTYDNVFEQIGAATRKKMDDFATLMTFLGELLRGLLHAFLHPRSVRWGDVLFYMKAAGVDGLPIVGLICLLLGLIIAFMSALQLSQFGADIYVASLVSVSMVRELGPIMTGILVAGRSGSAFAAEIGTMIVNEEVDALDTMAFDPVRFLAVPKVIASMVVVPVLTVYAAIAGIMGGMIIGVLGLDLTVNTYVTQSIKSLSAFGVVSSLIKSVVFAVLIAGIGCQRGFTVKGGAAGVGAATTSAVVAGIFLIIVTDSTFAIILHYIQ
jgi:phospholipid/cholesterol/gamma-HCH transport system permease protein